MVAPNNHPVVVGHNPRVAPNKQPNFKRLHAALESLYDFNVGSRTCGMVAPNNDRETTETEIIHLETSNLARAESSIQAAFDEAVKTIFANKGFQPEDLRKPEVKQVIEATYKTFLNAVETGIKHEIPEATMQALRKNVFVFSGMKTYTSLNEAGSISFTDKDGKPLSWHDFKKQADALNVKYNEHYLRTEYNFATASAQNVDKWEQLDDDSVLQYRTAEDDRVRDEHEAMAGITLPAKDPFWDENYPPNGWNCRCVAIEVRPGKYPMSDSKEAITKGRKATTQIGKGGINKAAVFRFNPGKDKKIFPDKHPYTSGNCDKLKAVWHTLSARQRMELANEGDKCRAKKEAERQLNAILRKEKKKELNKWISENIPENEEALNLDNFITKKVILTRGYMRDFSAHFADPDCKEMVKDIRHIIKTASQMEKPKPLNPKSHNYQKKKDRGVTHYGYYEFEWRNKKWRLNTEIYKGGYEKPYSANLLKEKEQ